MIHLILIVYFTISLKYCEKKLLFGLTRFIILSDRMSISFKSVQKVQFQKHHSQYIKERNWGKFCGVLKSACTVLLMTISFTFSLQNSSHFSMLGLGDIVSSYVLVYGPWYFLLFTAFNSPSLYFSLKKSETGFLKSWICPISNFVVYSFIYNSISPVLNSPSGKRAKRARKKNKVKLFPVWGNNDGIV